MTVTLPISMATATTDAVNARNSWLDARTSFMNTVMDIIGDDEKTLIQAEDLDDFEALLQGARRTL